MIEPLTFLPVILALAVAVAAMFPLHRLAPRLHLLDHPTGRKRHQAVTPLVGGYAVLLGFIAGLLVAGASRAEFVPLLVGLLLITACGMADDRHDLGGGVKLAAQAGVALLMVVWGGLVIPHLGLYPGIGTLSLGVFAVPFTVFAMVGFINAYNMIDGLDGLAGFVGGAILLWLLVIAALAGEPALGTAIAALGAALVGFLCFNCRGPWRQRASVFLGDAGSMMLGLAIAWFVIRLAQLESPPVSPMGLLWVVALPVLDTVSLMVRRAMKGRNPVHADREHLHHIFLRAGYSVGETAFLMLLLTLLLGGVGVLGSLAGVPDLLLLIGLVVVGTLHFVFIRYAWRTVKALRRLHRMAWWTAPEATAVPGTGWMGVRYEHSRILALAGLSVVALCLPFFPTGIGLGLVLVLAAGVLCLPALWSAVSSLPVFWLSAMLTVYVIARIAAVGFGNEAPWAPPWHDLLWVTGLLALPVGWWLLQVRRHWLWLFLLLVAGGAIGFVMEADWERFRTAGFAEREAWGTASVTGYLAAVAVVFLLAGAVAGLSRLGRGWRPVFLLAACLALSLPVLVVLVATGYATGWLGALVGAGVVAIIVLADGAVRRQWLSVAGVLVCLLVVGGLTWMAMSEDAPPVAESFTEPLDATRQYLAGDVQGAAATHRAMTRRLVTWAEALESFRGQVLLGTGRLSPDGVRATLRPDGTYESFYVSIAAGFGTVGLLLFGLVYAIFLRELVLLGRERLWPVPLFAGVAGAVAAVSVMLVFAVQVDDAPNRTVMLFLTAICAAAAFERRMRSRGGG